MKLLIESGLNVYSFLTVRAVCSLGPARLMAMREELEAADEKGGLEASEVYRSEDFRNLYNLVAQVNNLYEIMCKLYVLYIYQSITSMDLTICPQIFCLQLFQ